MSVRGQDQRDVRVCGRVRYLAFVGSIVVVGGDNWMSTYVSMNAATAFTVCV